MRFAVIPITVALMLSSGAQTPRTSKEVEAVFSDARALYVDLHQNPELSGHETQTAAKLASRLGKLGYDLTEHVEDTGVVAVLKNGPGPTIMLRTELGALPVEEKTGLPYASRVHAKDDAGQDVPVAHACGHDLHMAAIFGTAAIMANTKSTLLLIGQPAEETIGGAEGMIRDGLFERFPRPDVAVALHVDNLLPAGKVGIVPGTYDTNADSLRITIYGKSCHGSAPHTSIDPIVIAARTILALQTIPSREVKPGEMAVVTAALGKDNVVIQEPITASEDFSVFVRQGIPGFYFDLGGANPEEYSQAKAAGTTLPSNHSSLFAPDLDPALQTAIIAELAVLRNLLNSSRAELQKLTKGKSSSCLRCESSVLHFVVASTIPAPGGYKMFVRDLMTNHLAATA